MIINLDAVFPKRISFGARSEPEWATDLSEAGSGRESTNQRWSQTRHNFDVSLAVRTRDDYMIVRSHFHLVRGRALGFLFSDSLDHIAAAGDGVLSAPASSPSEYQMYRRYGSGSNLYDRRITRPESGTLSFFRTRSLVTTDITGSVTVEYGGASTDQPGGLVSIGGHMSGDTYTWTGQFFVPCRYAADRLPGVIVNRRPGENGPLLVQCDSIPLIEIRE